MVTTTPDVQYTYTRSVRSWFGLQEAHAQGAFGMDGTADASAASGMMGMSGYNPGQGAAFVSAETKASGELLWPSSSCKRLLRKAAANRPKVAQQITFASEDCPLLRLLSTILSTSTVGRAETVSHYLRSSWVHSGSSHMNAVQQWLYKRT